MKLVINYDLVNEIFKANTGINLKRFSSNLGLYLGIIGAVNLVTLPIESFSNQISMTTGIIYGLGTYGTLEYLTRDKNKIAADSRLNSLASSLTKINVYTDADLLKQAHKYKTKYKLVHNNDDKAIQQTKFILVPTTETLNASEISLQQEHIIGSKEYILSIGEPKKAYSKSKVSSSVFAR